MLAGSIRLDNREALLTGLSIPNDAAALKLADETLLLLAYEKWKENCVAHIQGDFAFAIHDTLRKTLFLAVDPLGACTLYYLHDPRKGLLFATNARAIRLASGKSAQLNEQQLANFATLITPDLSATFFKGISRLSHGHCLLLNLDTQEFTVRRYYNPNLYATSSALSVQDTVESFRETFVEAVKRRIVTSQPLSCHLSGGLDSSSVAAVAARQLEGSTPLMAYGVIPSRSSENPSKFRGNYDDRCLMQSISDFSPNIQLNLVHTDGDFFDELETFYEWADGPPFKPCNRIWIKSIHQKASVNKSPVLLTGSAGNFTLSYAGQHTSNSLRSVAGNMKGLALSWKKRLAARLGYNVIREFETGLAAPFAKQMTVNQRYLSCHSTQVRDLRHWYFQHGIRLTSYWQTLEVLYGVTHRDPTAAQSIFEFCLSLPNHVFTRNGQTRLLIRDAMKGILPDDVRLNTRRGMQFPEWPYHFDRHVPEFQRRLTHFSKQSWMHDYFDVKYLQDTLNRWPRHGLGYVEQERVYRYSWLRTFFLANYVNWFYETQS